MPQARQLDLLFGDPNEPAAPAGMPQRSPDITPDGGPAPSFVSTPHPASGTTHDHATGQTTQPALGPAHPLDRAPGASEGRSEPVTNRPDAVGDLSDSTSAHGVSVRIPSPQNLPMGARWREVACEQQSIGFVLLRSRRRTIGFLITDDGLRVTAPNWVTLAQIDAAVREKSRWILAKLRDWHTRQQKLALAQTRWQPGGEVPYLGKRIVLSLGADNRASKLEGDADAPGDGDVLRLALPATADTARVRDAAQSWLQGRARAVFGSRLAFFLQETGLRIGRWRLSGAATRWGSCTSDGNIMLNWRLIHFAPSIIDYVIAHELAHLREMNHSSDFWAEVGQILPDFEQARALLRKHDPATLPD